MGNTVYIKRDRVQEIFSFEQKKTMIKLLTVSERIRLPKCKIVWVVLDDVEFWIWCCLPQPHGIWDLTNECQACVIAIFDICTSYYLDLSRERGRVFFLKMCLPCMQSRSYLQKMVHWIGLSWTLSFNFIQQ